MTLIYSSSKKSCRTLEFVLNARQPIIEKSGPYCFIGVGPLTNQTPPSH
jgi:hypothetical protein